MIARCISVSKATSITTRMNQLVISQTDESGTLQSNSFPLEDIAVLEIDSTRTMISSALVARCAEYNIVVIVCDGTHHPVSMNLPIASHSSHTERLRIQVSAGLPIRKRLWQETVKAKLTNQAEVLLAFGSNPTPIKTMISKVKTGDSTNREATAATYYWKELFKSCPDTYGVELPFRRSPDGIYPNNLLNYTYAILRAAVARGLVSTGLHPSIGIFHKNKYNPYCLADDIMEPFRPFADMYVRFLLREFSDIAPCFELTPLIKKRLLRVCYLDTLWKGERRPLLHSITMSCANLWSALAGETTNLIYPTLCPIALIEKDEDQSRKNENYWNAYASTELCG